MAYQLIYTSVRRGLIPGRSGYTVAARHRQIRDRLVAELERISSYTFAKSGSSPVVYAHRKLKVSGAEFHILSRTVDAGSDYTGRTNHLAHHLVCEPDEIARCKITPAEVMLQFAWRDSYDEEPRYLGDDELVDIGGFPDKVMLPGKIWKSVRGEAADAALPLEEAAPRAGAIFVTPPGDVSWQQKMLELFAESLKLAAIDAHDPAAGWQVSFTTYYQPADDLSDFKWVGCEADDALLSKAGRRLVLDLSDLGPAVPGSKLAKLAETGSSAITLRRLTPPPSFVTAAANPPADAKPAEPEDDGKPDAQAVENPAEKPAASRAKSLVLLAPGPVASAAEPTPSEEWPPPGISARRSPLKDLRVLIPSLVVVFVGVILILHLTRSVEPWTVLKNETESALSNGEFAAANRILDQMKQKRPSWAERIERYRETEILPMMLQEADAAINYLRDAPDPGVAMLRLGQARAGVIKIDQYAQAYPSRAVETEVADLDRRIERLEREWEKRASAAANRDKPDVVAEDTSKEPRVEPEEVPRVTENTPPAVVIPPAIYLALKRERSGVAVPQSLPDLTQGPAGERKVALDCTVLEAGSPPWQIPESSSDPHDYKFPETAAEDDGSAMLPLAAKLDVQLRFQGKSRLEIQPAAAGDGNAGSGGKGKVWGSAQNKVLRFAGAEDKFWILMWDGQAMPITADSTLELRGSQVVPTDTLRRFLAALTPPVAAAVVPEQIVMRYSPPADQVEQPIESARLHLPVADAGAIAVDFAAFSARHAALITNLELKIEERERAVENAKGYLDWKEQADKYDRTLREMASGILGEDHEILIRHRTILDRPTSGLRRLAMKNFCADFLRDFWGNLKELGVEPRDLGLIDDTLSQDVFWGSWEKARIDMADGEEFAGFMAAFGAECRKLGSRDKVRTGDKENPYDYRIASRTARTKLRALAETWDKAFAEEAGASLWEFSKERRPAVPAEVERIKQFRADAVVASELLSDLKTGSGAISALEAGSPPPGTYQFDLVMGDGAVLPFARITIPTS